MISYRMFSETAGIRFELIPLPVRSLLSLDDPPAPVTASLVFRNFPPVFGIRHSASYLVTIFRQTGARRTCPSARTASMNVNFGNRYEASCCKVCSLLSFHRAALR